MGDKTFSYFFSPYGSMEQQVPYEKQAVCVLANKSTALFTTTATSIYFLGSGAGPLHAGSVGTAGA